MSAAFLLYDLKKILLPALFLFPKIKIFLFWGNRNQKEIRVINFGIKPSAFY